MRPQHRVKFDFPREPLLIEIERRCLHGDCAAKNQIGLTKSEAFEYRGFDCAHCEQWNDDRLNQKEIPSSWLDQIQNTQS